MWQNLSSNVCACKFVVQLTPAKWTIMYGKLSLYIILFSINTVYFKWVYVLYFYLYSLSVLFSDSVKLLRLYAGRRMNEFAALVEW